MDCVKIGKLIFSLRQKSQMTQKQLADKMGISDKTISKWERGCGLPDISLLGQLADIFKVPIETILAGEMDENTVLGGNMKKTRYFVCPICHNLVLATNEVTVSCCGNLLEPLLLQKASEAQKLHIELIEEEWFVTSNHPMTKENYIAFAAFATGERLEVIKLYPEWNMQFRMSVKRHGMLIWYSTSEGLFYQFI